MATSSTSALVLILSYFYAEPHFSCPHTVCVDMDLDLIQYHLNISKEILEFGLSTLLSVSFKQTAALLDNLVLRC